MKAGHYAIVKVKTTYVLRVPEGPCDSLTRLQQTCTYELILQQLLTVPLPRYGELYELKVRVTSPRESVSLGYPEGWFLLIAISILRSVEPFTLILADIVDVALRYLHNPQTRPKPRACLIC